jgi:hypothetical protein
MRAKHAYRRAYMDRQLPYFNSIYFDTYLEPWEVMVQDWDH